MKIDSVFSHEYFMRQAINEAQAAFDKNEVPIGAVIVFNSSIIARAHNLVETLNDPTAHAEMQAITSATNAIGAKYLNDCTLYVTIEPCPMCAAACFWAQIKTLVYGAGDEKRGFTSISEKLLHPQTQTVKGILENETAALIIEFFKQKRKVH
ncbi:MAG: nucleoside deaminase [Prevotellaceae bacterium]|jgi:tRNA(adenine34) deaminase|nr:nucleoside deaminase [Prevotellaceae bacterium]